MIIKTLATDQQSHKQRITLTNYANFALTSDEKKAAFVSQSGNQINFQPYWNPIRHAIARAHNTSMPNITKLSEVIPSVENTKHHNYSNAVEGYKKCLMIGGITGKKQKRFKADLGYSGVTLRLNPELALKSKNDQIFIIKLHMGKELSMTDSVASQMIHLMENEFSEGDKTHCLVFDVLAGRVFSRIVNTSTTINQISRNCKLYSDILARHNSSIEAA